MSVETVDAIRSFNRCHTRWVGALGDSYLDSGLTLSDVRVLYELAKREQPLAKEIARDLGLDTAYLSRILKRFQAAGWLTRVRSHQDGRAMRLALTQAGRDAFAPLEQASRDRLNASLDHLQPSQKARLAMLLAEAQSLIDGGKASGRVAIRTHRPGDIGWVVSAHGRLYAERYGWDLSFEALVAEIAAKFLRDFDPKAERCFIAELDGTPVGSAFVMRESGTVAKLRLVIVEERAQGLGLGKRLVRDAIGFARETGYARMVLWTNDILHAARAIYQAEGFRLVAEERHHSFGQDLFGQNWELDLSAA